MNDAVSSLDYTESPAYGVQNFRMTLYESFWVKVQHQHTPNYQQLHRYVRFEISRYRMVSVLMNHLPRTTYSLRPIGHQTTDCGSTWQTQSTGRSHGKEKNACRESRSPMNANGETKISQGWKITEKSIIIHTNGEDNLGQLISVTIQNRRSLKLSNQSPCYSSVLYHNYVNDHNCLGDISKTAFLCGTIWHIMNDA
jgi:hypothetical protein